MEEVYLRIIFLNMQYSYKVIDVIVKGPRRILKVEINDSLIVAVPISENFTDKLLQRHIESKINNPLPPVVIDMPRIKSPSQFVQEKTTELLSKLGDVVSIDKK